MIGPGTGVRVLCLRRCQWGAGSVLPGSWFSSRSWVLRLMMVFGGDRLQCQMRGLRFVGAPTVSTRSINLRPFRTWLPRLPARVSDQAMASFFH